MDDSQASGRSGGRAENPRDGRGRYDAFFALEPDKRQRIVDAALAEFSEKGFKLASTNAIAAKAQIGKGMLFYYFSSKEELFDFLCEYAIEFVKHEFLNSFDANTGDFIERQRRLAAAKRLAVKREPLLFALFTSFYSPKNSDSAAKSAKYAATLTRFRDEFLKRLYDGVDYSLFRADIDPSAAMRYIGWLLDRYTAEIMQKLRAGELDSDDDGEWAQFDAFIDDLNILFYNGREKR